METESSAKKCAIILLCGYLGAGKTTLIQHILKNQISYKVAVIQNEFSDGFVFKNPFFFIHFKKWGSRLL